MLQRCGCICVGGAVANTLLAARGVDMKASLLEREQLARGRALLNRARDQKVELLLPVDVLVGQGGDAADGQAVSVGSLPDGAGAYDIGPKRWKRFARASAPPRPCSATARLGRSKIRHFLAAARVF